MAAGGGKKREGLPEADGTAGQQWRSRQVGKLKRRQWKAVSHAERLDQLSWQLLGFTCPAQADGNAAAR